MRWIVAPSTLQGTCSVPGDKSIAHRALMLGALARGTTYIRGLPSGEAVLATAACLRAVGVEIAVDGDTAEVSSCGILEPPNAPLDTGNSGTSMRLLAGILVGQPFPSVLTGDAWLRRRPMARIVEPLSLMGARITSLDGRAPLEIRPARLHGIRYTLPVASAQVKSAILLAGLFADGDTTVVEPAPTRDHTERMMRALGVEVDTQETTVTMAGGQRPDPFELDVPADPSSAAFFYAAGLLTGGEVRVEAMLVNPTRTGFLNAVARMGAVVTMRNPREVMGEPVADVVVSGHLSNPLTVDDEEVPLLVDELPLLALLATQVRGTSSIRGAAELRVKETDRIAGVTRVLRAMGADITGLPDGFLIGGSTSLRGTTVSSGGDHRLAMMAAVAGTVARGTTIIEDANAAAVSFPEFDSEFHRAGGALEAA